MRSDVHGLLVLDKPLGITSRAAVDRALKWFPRGSRIGHTGTLDPLATGVLVLCIGVATRLAEYVQRMEKTYITRLRLGARSNTDDAEGIIASVEGVEVPSAERVAKTLQDFVGEIEQVPPAYSAAKIGGRRAYAVARKGHDVELSARTVKIHQLNMVRLDYPHLDLEVRCGKGTYIRSLARDIGARLGCGAYIDTLRRTCVGPFDVTYSVTLDVDAQKAQARLLPVHAAVCQLPLAKLGADDIHALRCGRSVRLAAPAEGEIAVFDDADLLVCVGVCEAALLRPAKVFNRFTSF